VVEEVIKAKKVKTSRSIKDSFVFHTQRFYSFMKKSRGYVKIFLNWVMKHIKYGIQCSKYGLNQMKCRTLGGLTKLISMKNWKRIPSFLRNRWTITTLTTSVYYRNVVGK